MPTLQTSIVFKIGDDDVAENKLVTAENDDDTLGINEDVAKDNNNAADGDDVG